MRPNKIPLSYGRFTPRRNSLRHIYTVIANELVKQTPSPTPPLKGNFHFGLFFEREFQTPRDFLLHSNRLSLIITAGVRFKKVILPKDARGLSRVFQIFYT